MNPSSSCFFENCNKSTCIHIIKNNQQILWQAEAVFPTARETTEKWKEWEIVSNEIKKPEIRGIFKRTGGKTNVEDTQELLSGEGKDRQAVAVVSALLAARLTRITGRQ